MKQSPEDILHGMLETEELNSIYPFVWKENKNYIESGGNYIKVLAVVAYPKEQKRELAIGSEAIKRKHILCPVPRTVQFRRHD
ncbi:hypothetical protein RCO48_08225 [Peribacillus frigoritolerans]|nr:hypothetical protein [Peribacillus frigoritolerans]